MLPPLDNAVFLDTETTGLGDDDQVVEIAVIDIAGRPLLDTLVKPTCSVTEGAANVHGITAAELLHAPDFPTVWPQLLDAVRDRDVIIYNVIFDLRLLHQSATAHSVDAAALINAATTYSCAMQAYAEYWGDYNYYHSSFRWQSLSKAIRQQKIALPPDLRPHRALADCHMTRLLVLKMAEEQDELSSVQL